MNRVKRLFRGSGRVLGLIFAASVAWLIFDMAALRFSFSEINSKLSKEEFVRLERLRTKVLQDQGLHKMFRRRPDGRRAEGARLHGDPPGVRDPLPPGVRDPLHGNPAERDPLQGNKPGVRAPLPPGVWDPLQGNPAVGAPLLGDQPGVRAPLPPGVRVVGDPLHGDPAVGAPLHGDQPGVRDPLHGDPAERAPLHGDSLGVRAPLHGDSLGVRAPLHGDWLGVRAPLHGDPPGKQDLPARAAAPAPLDDHRPLLAAPGTVWKPPRAAVAPATTGRPGPEVRVPVEVGAGAEGRESPQRGGGKAEAEGPSDRAEGAPGGQVEGAPVKSVLIQSKTQTRGEVKPGGKGEVGNPIDNNVPVAGKALDGAKGEAANIMGHKPHMNGKAGHGAKDKAANIMDHKIPVDVKDQNGVKSESGNIKVHKNPFGFKGRIGVEGDAANISDIKIPVGGKAWDQAKGELVYIVDKRNPIDRKEINGAKDEGAHIIDHKIPPDIKVWHGIGDQPANSTDSKNPVGIKDRNGVQGEAANISDNKIPVGIKNWNEVKVELVNPIDNEIPVGGDTWNRFKGEPANIMDHKMPVSNKDWNGIKGESVNITDNKITGGGKDFNRIKGEPANLLDNKIPVVFKDLSGVKGEVANSMDHNISIGNKDRNGVKRELAILMDNKIPVGGKDFNGVKGEPDNLTDSKIPVGSKIWKGMPGQLINIAVTKNGGIKQNIMKITPLTNMANAEINFKANKSGINLFEGKNLTEKKDFSVIIDNKLTVKNNEMNDQQIDDAVLKRPVVNFRSALREHRVLSIDRTISPRDPEAMGQFGQPAVVPKDQEGRAKEKWNEGHFNVYLSNMIPLDRAVPDTRPKGCSDQMIHNNLPTTSIILCFVDEVWSTLLRSVHSIFNRSPSHLIKEVILVDDFSTREYLKENLDKYMSRFPKVHVIHLQERHGLIRARLVGTAKATGDVLTFLDSHVECNVGWLEPLLERIHLKRTKVACPVIEVISDEDMSYIGVNGFLRGVFTWPMNFGWKSIPDGIIKKYNLTEMDPIKCPIMAGGLFSIDKKYFHELGMYDRGLEVWGGENMELSFKVWMCGGEIEIIPCSRVGHIFRDGNPYTFPKDRIKTVERNLARVAEVWLDEYVDVFYGHGYHHLLDTNNIEFNIGDLSEQKELRKKLQCKSFKWYLENIYPDIQTSFVKSDGLLFNVGTRKCLAVENGTFSFEICDTNKKNQHFSHSWLRLIQHMDLCIALLDMKREIGMRPCDKKNNNLRWLHESFTAESTLTDHILWEISQFPLCLEGNLFGKVLMMNSCDHSNPHQKWKFTNYYKD
ncbi:uncharacterized protein LOC116975242 isoform X2 [Amblyraja radiata]|uniref:uncharacterized protein LOC116975242 isoform X2 n=1 Tax=Amblyraja radiata TaxID=386614 RepID=UPI0014034180|nr:uncharacterized protein LOC116975242 isoform X2 [Amblyraja radiata]